MFARFDVDMEKTREIFVIATGCNYGLESVYAPTGVCFRVAGFIAQHTSAAICVGGL
jgi:hypothetical protein